MNSRGNIYLIDDDDSFRAALARVLVETGYAVHEFANPHIFIENLKFEAPSVILLDMRLPKITGLDVQKILHKLGHNTPIIYLSGHSQPQQIVEGLKKGAVDFLFKPVPLDALFNAIETGFDLDRENVERLASRTDFFRRYHLLTPREKEVSQLLADGLMNKEIAFLLGISDSTVKVHKAEVMWKLEVNSLQNLATLFHKFIINEKHFN
jgi:FixJ family two-component response regulator